MGSASKRMRAISEQVIKGKAYPFIEAVKLLKTLPKLKFNESLDVSINLGVDPRKSDQTVRGMVVLPQGTGRLVRVAVFAQGEQAEAALKAGAEQVGLEDLAAAIKEGILDFDVLIAAPEAMPLVGQLGPLLGPRGLMPNPKLGTVTSEVAVAVRNAHSGQVNYRADKGGIVHVLVGKLDFDSEHIQQNVEVLLAALRKDKPVSANRSRSGSYFKRITLSSTMGPGMLIDQASLNMPL